MLRLVLSGALVCTLCTLVCAEEKTKANTTSSAAQTVIIEEASGSGIKEIDNGRRPRNGNPNDGVVNDSGAMPSYETYDPNTGLPNKVASDAAGEFD